MGNDNYTAIVRGARPNIGQGVVHPPGLTGGGEQIVSEGLPPLTEIVRQGNSWYGLVTTHTHTLNQALPTIAAAATLWNGNATGGKSLVIEAVGYKQDVSGAAANISQMFAMPSIAAVATVPATAEAGSIRGLRLGTTYGGNAKLSITVTVTDNGWIPLSGTLNTAALTATIGLGEYIPVNGLFIIPPGFYLALHCSGTAATAAFQSFFVWHEVQLELL